MFIYFPFTTQLQALDRELAKLTPADLRALMIGRVRALPADERDRTVVAVATGAGAEQALQAVSGLHSSAGAVRADAPWRVMPVARHITALLRHGEQALEKSIALEQRRALRSVELGKQAAAHLATTQAEIAAQTARNADAWRRENDARNIVVGGSVL